MLSADERDRVLVGGEWDLVDCPYCQTHTHQKLALRQGRWLMICWTCVRLLEFDVEACCFVLPPSVLDVRGQMMDAD